MEIKEVFKKEKDLIKKEIEVKGWIRKHRKQKEIGFIELSDGTCFKKIQVVYDSKLKEFRKKWESMFFIFRDLTTETGGEQDVSKKRI